LPKLREKATKRILGSSERSRLMISRVASVDPSSTKRNSICASGRSAATRPTSLWNDSTQSASFQHGTTILMSAIGPPHVATQRLKTNRLLST